jgi:hypothetical protein
VDLFFDLLCDKCLNKFRIFVFYGIAVRNKGLAWRLGLLFDLGSTIPVVDPVTRCLVCSCDHAMVLYVASVVSRASL